MTKKTRVRGNLGGRSCVIYFECIFGNFLVRVLMRVFWIGLGARGVFILLWASYWPVLFCHSLPVQVLRMSSLSRINPVLSKLPYIPRPNRQLVQSLIVNGKEISLSTSSLPPPTHRTTSPLRLPSLPPTQHHCTASPLHQQNLLQERTSPRSVQQLSSLLLLWI